jgi:hypothetical protein
MGEFSAGKTTLANLLIGESPLPVRIIADPYQVDLEGHQSPIALDALDGLDLTRILYLQLFSDADLLTHCDLLDMPGISDPNMNAVIWERMIDQAHGVIWCSNAVQAWRQSEAAVWAEIPAHIHAHICSGRCCRFHCSWRQRNRITMTFGRKVGQGLWSINWLGC